MAYTKDAQIEATYRIERAGSNPTAKRRTVQNAVVGCVPCPSCGGRWPAARNCSTCNGMGSVRGMRTYGDRRNKL
jgi:predicted nucleic acid binding AN1-type Zn finger protein